MTTFRPTARRVLAAGVLLALAGCSKPEPPPPYNVEIDMATLMGHVLDPASDIVWGASGYVLTEAGEEDLSPKTQAEWDNVENGAVTVAEVGNLLMLPGRALEGEANWTKYSQALTTAGLKAQKAALAHDKQGVFDAGGEIYEVCTACHQQYVMGETAAAASKSGG